MELDSLKSFWKNADQEESTRMFRTEEQLGALLNEKAGKTFGKVKRRVVFDILTYVVAIYVFIDWFDAFRNVWYINALIFAVLIVGIVNNLLVKRALNAKFENRPVREGLNKIITRFQQQIKFTVLFHILFCFAVFAFFAFRESATSLASKPGPVIVIVVLSIVKIAIEYKRWSDYVKDLKIVSAEMNDLNLNN
jgi:hypothetical protein